MFDQKIRRISLNILRYCGSDFVGHYGSEQLLHHFMELREEMQWYPDYLLHIGIDGPNANLKFQEDLKGAIQCHMK